MQAISMAAAGLGEGGSQTEAPATGTRRSYSSLARWDQAAPNRRRNPAHGSAKECTGDDVTEKVEIGQNEAATEKKTSTGIKRPPARIVDPENAKNGARCGHMT